MRSRLLPDPSPTPQAIPLASQTHQQQGYGSRVICRVLQLLPCTDILSDHTTNPYIHIQSSQHFVALHCPDGQAGTQSWFLISFLLKHTFPGQKPYSLPYPTLKHIPVTALKPPPERSKSQRFQVIGALLFPKVQTKDDQPS